MVAQWKLERRLWQQNYRCPWCGQPLTLAQANAEHIIPDSMGGTDAYANIAATHPRCNRSRSSNIWQDPVPGPEFDFIRQILKLLRAAEGSPDGLMILPGAKR